LTLFKKRSVYSIYVGNKRLYYTAVWDGEHLFMDNFIEGETEL